MWLDEFCSSIWTACKIVIFLMVVFAMYVVGSIFITVNDAVDAMVAQSRPVSVQSRPAPVITQAVERNAVPLPRPRPRVTIQH